MGDRSPVAIPLRAPARLQSEARFPSSFTVVDSTSNRELINTDQGVLKPHTVGGRLFGNVASVLIVWRGLSRIHPENGNSFGIA